MTEISVCSRKGNRDTMEDTHIVDVDLMQDNTMIALHAVFDGHRGKHTSLYLQQSYADVLRSCIVKQRDLDSCENGLYESALRESFAQCEKGCTAELESRLNDQSGERNVTGSTAAVVLVVDNNTVYCANAGDSEVVVGRRIVKPQQTSVGEVDYEYIGVCLSTLHKPDTELERSRIDRAGGFVATTGFVARVGGHPRHVNLSVSRSFGDSDVVGHETQQPLIISRPDISKTQASDDDVIIVACDGLWDVYEYKCAVREAYEHRDTSECKTLCRNTAEHLCNRAIDDLGSEDNVTTIVVFMSADKSRKWVIYESIEHESQKEGKAE